MAVCCELAFDVYFFIIASPTTDVLIETNNTGDMRTVQIFFYYFIESMNYFITNYSSESPIEARDLRDFWYKEQTLAKAQTCG